MIDPERTVMPPGHNPVPAGSSAEDRPATSAEAGALPAGTRLNEFEIVGLIGIGGFGIVYLAKDHSLDREVAIKEYMPTAFAARMNDKSVAVRSARHADTFAAGLRSFINEARLLARFDHPSLVKVYRFWEANGTGYMAMPYYKGPTLKRALAEGIVTPNEKWLRGLLTPLMDALEVLHSAQCCHRDVAPDNILLLEDGRPLLLDFGAARHVIGDMTQALTVMLKPGYAPLEQYAESPSMKQGPWTDVYGLCAVVYFAISRRPPVPSVGRVMSDAMEPLSSIARGRYSEPFLRAIDAGLAVRPENRPHSMQALRRLLDSAPTPHDDVPPTKSADRDPDARIVRFRRWVFGGVAVAAALALAMAVLLVWDPLHRHDEAITANNAPDKTVAATEPSIAATPEPAGTPEPGRGSGAPSDSSGSGVTARAGAAAGAPTNPQAVVVQPTGPADKEKPAAAFDPLRVLNSIYQGRDPQQDVTVKVDKPQVRIGRDPLGFTITASKDGYAYVLVVGTSDRDFYMLFPNAVDSDNRITANTPLRVPHRLPMMANGPPGTNHFVVIVSEQRREFSALRPRRKDVFEEFPAEVAAQLQQSNSERQPLFAGGVKCAEQTQCSQAYGAAAFSIEEI
jgi:serine/threonine protein kinase